MYTYTVGKVRDGALAFSRRCPYLAFTVGEGSFS